MKTQNAEKERRKARKKRKRRKAYKKWKREQARLFDVLQKTGLNI